LGNPILYNNVYHNLRVLGAIMNEDTCLFCNKTGIGKYHQKLCRSALTEELIDSIVDTFDYLPNGSPGEKKLIEIAYKFNLVEHQLKEAKFLLSRVINPESRPPDPWYDILFDITTFLRENE
jgi:hypothetical protein